MGSRSGQRLARVYPEICEKFAAALKIDARNTEAYNNWGSSLDELRRYTGACEKYAKAVAINPRYAEFIGQLDEAAQLKP